MALSDYLMQDSIVIAVAQHIFSLILISVSKFLSSGFGW